MSTLAATWLAAALAPPRAHGEPVCSARLRAVPEDFQVDEVLGFAPAGRGSHWLLQVRKRGANTEWVARELAKRAGVRSHDVGFAGLKDRHAVTTQWFTVPRPHADATQWQGVQGEGYEVMAAHEHDRKLRRGALSGNRFDIRLTALPDSVDRAAIEARLAVLADIGVPNYFGPQRFGRECGNLLRAARYSAAPVAEQRPGPDRSERSFALSAARSLIFNTALAQRVQARSWNQLQVGDLANFDDGQTIFAVSDVDEVLRLRCESGELHPTGPLWGAASLAPQGDIAASEARAAAQCAPLDSWLLAEGLRAERRALRLRVHDLQHEWAATGTNLRLCFRLNAGSFATTVLRELISVADGDLGREA